MEEKIQAEEGLSLLDIIRVLFSKIKILILVVLIGGIAGAGLAIWRTHDVKYYGTTVEFYVNPEKPKETGSSSTITQNAVGSQYGVYGAYGRHVMDAIVKLLSSESFAEKMMLGDNGLPSPNYPNATKSEYDEAVSTADEASNAWDKSSALDKPWREKLDVLEEAWSDAGLPGSYNYSSYLKYINSLDGKHTQKDQELISAYEEWNSIDEKREAAINVAKALQIIADEEAEDVLEEWRDTQQYKTELKKYKEALTFSYLEDDADVEDANNLARSFLYVKVNVLNDEAFAVDLLKTVWDKVPKYVEQNMIVPADYEGTSCTRITRTDEIARTNENYTRNQAIKYALLFAAAAGVIAAVVVIIIDRSDKRLRDYEIIPKNFNVPVLGVIPTIEEINALAEAKKKNGEARK
ncbi:MAG: hypothetical protein IKZ28_02115 [Clostridia bacterium]|nr:hypothetical protein [Clostridia bacterium]